MQLEAVASHPITSYLGEETNTCLTTTSFQVAVESSKASPQPPLFQKKEGETDRTRNPTGFSLASSLCYPQLFKATAMVDRKNV